MTAVTFEAQVCEALETRLGTLWEDIDENAVLGRVAYDGFDPDPAWSGARRAKVAIEWDPSSAETVGAPTVKDRHPGTLLVWILEPAGDGIGPLRECAGRLSVVFRRWSNPGSPQINMGAPFFSGAPIRDGAAMQIAWRCPFVSFGTFPSEPV